MRFRPRNAREIHAPKDGYLRLHSGSYTMKSVRNNRIFALIFMGFLFWVLKLLLYFPSFSNHHLSYPLGHPPGTVQTVRLASQYLYPPIEDADILRALDPRALFYTLVISDFTEDREVIYSLNYVDDEDPVKQKLKEDKENAALAESQAKNHFKNQQKVVYMPKLNAKYPKVVVVTAVDFNKYSTAALAKIVQNRVNYAHEHDFGVYVRWLQEFIPELGLMDVMSDKEQLKWIRIFCMRAAMFAFPEAEWFWYFDQDGVVKNMSVDLYTYILEPNALRASTLKEQSIMPPSGLIKTYKHIQPSNVHLIFTQLETHIETNSFIVKNTEIGRAAVDSWCIKLYRDYNDFNFGPDSAITHILQWHPFFLSKTAIVSARTINSLYDENDFSNKKTSDHVHYFSGDFLAQWSRCASATECELMAQKVTEEKT